MKERFWSCVLSWSFSVFEPTVNVTTLKLIHPLASGTCYLNATWTSTREIPEEKKTDKMLCHYHCNGELLEQPFLQLCQFARPGITT